MDADFDRVVPLPTTGADDLWPKSMDDIGAFDDDDSEGPIPLDVLERLLDGEHPLKVFRRHRALTQKQLADLTGLNATYLSQIETRKRRGSTRVYRRLATALGVDIGDLIE
ncbi:MAG: helix-turn-helix domain-containing protein [Alphaproteobacteria bacterium]|nr:helix-turn-helix domain-containing protein [Alphaproteobacteria bacterium]